MTKLWLPWPEPDYSGQWRVFRLQLPPDDLVDYPATLGAWLLDCPGAHPFWRFHTLNLVHLRELEGQPPVRLAFPGASHELLVLALDPHHDAELTPLDWKTCAHFMMPPDASVQFVAQDDEAALHVAELAARAVAEGVLIPDSDYASHWEGTIQLTAEHVRIGEHPDG